MMPRVVKIVNGREIRFEQAPLLNLTSLVLLRHAFEIVPVGPNRSELRQRFESSGAFQLPLWPMLRAGMLQFEELGHDLAKQL